MKFFKLSTEGDPMTRFGPIWRRFLYDKGIFQAKYIISIWLGLGRKIDKGEEHARWSVYLRFSLKPICIRCIVFEAYGSRGFSRTRLWPGQKEVSV
jgi:hypothetical protein